MRLEMSTANKNKLAYVGSKPGIGDTNRDSDSWFTPKKYMDAARKVLGKFDLDPFSSPIANQTVQASKFFTINNSAFDNDWTSISGRKIKTVWMNPPYGKVMSQACAKFVEEFKAGSFEEGIVLTNNATETIWFKNLARCASAVCFTDHRIKFEAFDGKESTGNTRGQTFFYFGKDYKKFHAEFKKFGLCYKTMGE